jgi:hypothetical protein
LEFVDHSTALELWNTKVIAFEISVGNYGWDTRIEDNLAETSHQNIRRNGCPESWSHEKLEWIKQEPGKRFKSTS